MGAGVLGPLAIFCQIIHGCVSALRNPYQINFGLSHWIRIMNKCSWSLTFIFMTPSSSWGKIKLRSFNFYWMLTAVFGDVNNPVLLRVGLVKVFMTPPCMPLSTDLLQNCSKASTKKKGSEETVMLCLLQYLINSWWMNADSHRSHCHAGYKDYS